LDFVFVFVVVVVFLFVILSEVRNLLSPVLAPSVSPSSTSLVS